MSNLKSNLHLAASRLLRDRLSFGNVQAMFAYDFDDPGFQPDYLESDILEAIRGSVNARQILQSEYQQIEEDVRVLRNEVLRNAKQNCPLPVNLRRLIWNAQKLFSCKPHKPGPAGKQLTPLQAVLPATSMPDT